MALKFVSDQEFEGTVLASNLPTIVQFTATWCGPCKQISPIVESIANDYVGKVNVVKVDIDESPESARRYGIRSIPTLVMFEGGQKVKQHVGLAPKDLIIKTFLL
jgi:thioredoxin 1